FTYFQTETFMNDRTSARLSYLRLERVAARRKPSGPLPALAPSGIFRTIMLRAGKAALTKTIPLPTKKPAGNDLPHQL
ncbi:hypothetical protein, partial [Akkermansia sp.]